MKSVAYRHKQARFKDNGDMSGDGTVLKVEWMTFTIKNANEITVLQLTASLVS